MEHDPTSPESAAPSSPEFKRPLAELIRDLEVVNAPVDEKVELLLVALHEKHSSMFHVTEETRTPILPHPAPGDPKIRGQFDNLVAWAEHSGLPFMIDGRTEVGYNEAEPTAERDRTVLYVAEDPVWLEKIHHAELSNNTRLMGESLGYPPAAAAVFATPESVQPPELAAIPDLAPEVRAFAKFAPSRANIEADLATAKRWAEAVKVASPNMYQEMLEHRAAMDAERDAKAD